MKKQTRAVDEIARQMEELPYKIIPGDIATYRESVFLERAIVGERIRMTMACLCRVLINPSKYPMAWKRLLDQRFITSHR